MEGRDGIRHRYLSVNGIRMHVAEKGEGPVVLLVHGFPELWYSWRHQIIALSSRGFHAVAPDLRGYGDTEAPPSAESYTCLHLVGDLVALIDALGHDQVFVVGHDWGALITWQLCLMRPDMVKALVNLSVPYHRRNPTSKPVQRLRANLGEDYYIVSFQEPGEMEARIAKLGTEYVLKKILTYRNPEPLYVKKHIEEPFGDEITLPSWLTPEDVAYFTKKFEASGFTPSINYYRCWDLNWELTAPWSSAKVKVPAKFILGDLDLTYNYPGVKDYINKGGMQKHVPFLQDVVVMEGVGHFIQQERADEITEHIYSFISKFCHDLM